MNKFLQTSAVAALSVFLLAACTQPSQQTNTDSANQAQNQPAGNQASTTANPAAKKLCELLPVAQVSALAGVTLTKSEQNIDNSGNPSITDCFYSNGDGNSVSIIANYDNGSRTAKDAYKELVAYQAKQEANFPSEKLTGVGEEAFAVNTGIVTQINALNKNVWLTLSVYTNDEKPAQKDKAIAIAKKAFEVL